MDLEVDRVRVDAWRIAGVKHRLLQRRLLLAGQIGAALCLAGGSCLALGGRIGLALRDISAGGRGRIPILRALALCAGPGLVLTRRLLGLLAVGFTLVVSPVVGSARILP